MSDDLVRVLAGELVRLNPAEPPLALARATRAALDDAVPGWRSVLLGDRAGAIEVAVVRPGGKLAWFVLCATPEATAGG